MAALLITARELRYSWRQAVLNSIAIAAVVFAFLLLFSLGKTLGSLAVEADINRNLVVIEGDIVYPADATLNKEAVDAAEEIDSRLVSQVSPMIFRHLRFNEKLVQLRAADLDDWTGIHHLSLINGHFPEGPAEVAVTEAAASVIGGDINDVLTIYGTQFSIVGIVAMKGIPFASIWMDLSQAEELYGHSRGYQLMLVEAAPGVDAEQVRAELTADPRISTNYHVFFEDTYTKRNTRAMSDLEGIAQAMGFISLFAIALGTYNATSLYISEKGRQLGILRIVGFDLQTILRIQILQTTVQALAGFFIGLLAAALFLYLRDPNQQLVIFSWPLNFALTTATILLGLILTLLFSWIGTILSARRINLSSPLEALAI